jgi:hypothetical protein
VKQGGLAEARLGTGRQSVLIDDGRHRDCPFGQRRNSNTGRNSWPASRSCPRTGSRGHRR